ncbi:hypothetical protein [Actinoplanes sp. NPDC051494]|uniref:hypothetical protein n=1 Tax=Actinoplanes sp. NPDC051494 TaxID=3363907 RepID=UPI003796D9A4
MNLEATVQLNRGKLTVDSPDDGELVRLMGWMLIAVADGEDWKDVEGPNGLRATVGEIRSISVQVNR